MNGLGWSPPSTFDYAFRLPDPQPVSGCDDCSRFIALRTAARASGDRSAATDANVSLRHHLAREH